MSDQAVITSGAPQRAPARSTPSRTDLRVVREAKKRSRARQLTCTLALVVMFSALLASAVFHSALVSGQQRLDHLNQQVDERQQQLSRSQLRVAQLSSPARIVSAAKQAGMVVPNHTTWLAATPPTTAPPSFPAAGKAAGGANAGGSELASGGGGANPAGGHTRSGRVR